MGGGRSVRAVGGVGVVGAVVGVVALVLGIGIGLRISADDRRSAAVPAAPAAAAPSSPVATEPMPGGGAVRDTGPVAALEAAAVLARSSAAAEAVAPVSTVTTVGGCRWDDDDREAGGVERDRRTVELAYCVLLGRAPDVEGSTYWTGQLTAGLPAGELMAQLAGSPEYLRGRPGRQQPGWSPVAALSSIRPTGSGTEIGGGDAPAGERGSPPTGIDFDAWVAENLPGEVETITPALVHTRIVGDGQQVNVAVSHLAVTQPPRVSPADRGRATVGAWAAEIGADVAVNGNWYAPWDGPAVSGGVVYGGADHGYTALFGFTTDGQVLVEHHREVNDGVDPRIVEGLSGHPTLVHRGVRTTDFGTDPTFLNRHPRTAIGVDESGRFLILVTVDGRSSRARGMTGDETATLLASLGAHEAVMLDGGGSTTMWITGRGVVNDPSGSLRAVGNQIAVFGR